MRAILLAGLLSMTMVSSAEPLEVLRVCADPDNLPFSSSQRAEPGFYVEVAELVAQKLGARTEYVWWLTHYSQRAMRNTLLASSCDAHFGIPDDKEYMGRALARTRPILAIGYAIVLPPGSGFGRLDELKGKRVGVQFGSSAQLELATRDGFQAVTFRLVEEAMDALARRELDAAFVWGPSAGYYNRRKLAGVYRVIPVSGPGLQWKASVGVRKQDTDLRDTIDAALASLETDIRRVAESYGFPLQRPVALDGEGRVSPAVNPGEGPRGGARNPFRGDVSVIPAGRSQFNQHCAHCHAPNAQSAEPSRDLRRLHVRYGEHMMETYYVTITKGRADKGMPPWREILSDEHIWQIFTFLESVQRQP